MESYKIEWRKSTKKDLRKIPPQQVKKIISSVETLGSDPFPPGNTKLTGSEFTYRIRVGDYRVVYEVRELEILIEVVRVRHRKDVYRK